MTTKMLEQIQAAPPVQAAPPEARPTEDALPEPFTPEELRAFQGDDWHAAAAITSIMAAILAAGLIAYIFIACFVWAYPN